MKRKIAFALCTALCLLCASTAGMVWASWVIKAKPQTIRPTFERIEVHPQEVVSIEMDGAFTFGGEQFLGALQRSMKFTDGEGRPLVLTEGDFTLSLREDAVLSEDGAPVARTAMLMGSTYTLSGVQIDFRAPDDYILFDNGAALTVQCKTAKIGGSMQTLGEALGQGGDIELSAPTKLSEGSGGETTVTLHSGSVLRGEALFIPAGMRLVAESGSTLGVREVLGKENASLVIHPGATMSVSKPSGAFRSGPVSEGAAYVLDDAEVGWEQKPLYTIGFDANGGSFAGGEAPEDVFCTARDNIDFPTPPVRDGFVFKGWSLDGETVLESSRVSTVCGEEMAVVLKAVWREAVRVTFCVGGEVWREILYEKGMPVDPSEFPPEPPAPEGSRFDGWYTAAEGGVKFQGEPMESDTRWYAHFSPC